MREFLTTIKFLIVVGNISIFTQRRSLLKILSGCFMLLLAIAPAQAEYKISTLLNSNGEIRVIGNVDDQDRNTATRSLLLVVSDTIYNIDGKVGYTASSSLTHELIRVDFIGDELIAFHKLADMKLVQISTSVQYPIMSTSNTGQHIIVIPATEVIVGDSSYDVDGKAFGSFIFEYEPQPRLKHLFSTSSSNSFAVNAQVVQNDLYITVAAFNSSIQVDIGQLNFTLPEYTKWIGMYSDGLLLDSIFIPRGVSVAYSSFGTSVSSYLTQNITIGGKEFLPSSSTLVGGSLFSDLSDAQTLIDYAKPGGGASSLDEDENSAIVRIVYQDSILLNNSQVITNPFSQNFPDDYDLVLADYDFGSRKFTPIVQVSSNQYDAPSSFYKKGENLYYSIDRSSPLYINEEPLLTGNAKKLSIFKTTPSETTALAEIDVPAVFFGRLHAKDMWSSHQQLHLALEYVGFLKDESGKELPWRSYHDLAIVTITDTSLAVEPSAYKAPLELTAYPNPTTRSFTLKGSRAPLHSYNLYNGNGKLIETANFSGNSILHVEQPGYYIINAIDREGQHYTVKVLCQ